MKKVNVEIGIEKIRDAILTDIANGGDWSMPDFGRLHYQDKERKALEEDGLILMGGSDLYVLTVKGSLFLQAGGYAGNRARRDKFYSGLPNWLAVAISLAALVVSIFALFQGN